MSVEQPYRNRRILKTLLHLHDTEQTYLPFPGKIAAVLKDMTSVSVESLAWACVIFNQLTHSATLIPRYLEDRNTLTSKRRSRRMSS